MLCLAMLCGVVLCYVMLCHVMAMLWYIDLLCHVLSCCVFSVTSCGLEMSHPFSSGVMVCCYSVPCYGLLCHEFFAMIFVMCL